MRHRVKKTKFEAFSQKFLIISMVIFIFGITYVRSLESSCNQETQQIEKDIKVLKDEIDSLEMQKQELASFSRLNDVAGQKGYTYSNESVASSTPTEGAQ